MTHEPAKVGQLEGLNLHIGNISPEIGGKQRPDKIAGGNEAAINAQMLLVIAHISHHLREEGEQHRHIHDGRG